MRLIASESDERHSLAGAAEKCFTCVPPMIFYLRASGYFLLTKQSHENLISLFVGPEGYSDAILPGS